LFPPKNIVFKWRKTILTTADGISLLDPKLVHLGDLEGTKEFSDF
jgi:hypothetical protein